MINFTVVSCGPCTRQHSSYLTKVFCQSCLSVIIWVTDVKQAVVHRSDIYLAVKENSGKLQLEDRILKIVRPVIASNGIPYLQMTSVGSHKTSGREGEGRKEGRKERIGREVGTKKE